MKLGSGLPSFFVDYCMLESGPHIANKQLKCMQGNLLSSQINRLSRNHFSKICNSTPFSLKSSHVHWNVFITSILTTPAPPDNSITTTPHLWHRRWHDCFTITPEEQLSVFAATNHGGAIRRDGATYLGVVMVVDYIILSFFNPYSICRYYI